MAADILEIICMRHVYTDTTLEVKERFLRTLGTKWQINFLSIHQCTCLPAAGITQYPGHNSSIVVIVKVRGSAYTDTAASCLPCPGTGTTRRYLLVISGQG